MQKRMFLCFAVLLVTAVSTWGVQNKTMETYRKWKAENEARLSAAGNATQYIGQGEAQIDFVFDGHGQDDKLIIQPLKIKKIANGESTPEKVGEVSTVEVNGFGEFEKANPLFSTAVKVNTGVEANAIEVRWKIGGKSPDGSRWLTHCISCGLILVSMKITQRFT